MIAIARAVNINCSVLILDEPTSSLDEEEVKKLFALMKQLKNDGVGIVFITHFLDQVYKICDRITVLRNGELIGEYPAEKLPRLQLVAKMMGRELDDLSALVNEKPAVKESKEIPLVEACGLSSGYFRFAPFYLKMYCGDVVGFGGLLGSGRSELVRTIYGVDKAVQGSIFVRGKKVKIKKPLDAIKLRMAYLPEDRKADGIISELSVKENIIIALQAKQGVFKRLGKKEKEKFADEYISLLI